MGVTFNAKITMKGDFKADEFVSELLELKPSDTVSITINSSDKLKDNYNEEREEITIMNNNENFLVCRNEQFGELEIMIINGKEYFPATECAKILGYTNPRKAIIDHCKGVTKRDSLSSGGIQEKNYIPEGDLYRLIARSRLPEAQKFESWIFDNVIPSIRKNKMYLTPEALHEALSNPKWLAEMLLKLDSEQKKRQEVETENTFLSAKVKYLDQILQSNEAVQVTKIAKDYGLSAMTFNKMLHDFGVQYPVVKMWILYQKYANKGYTNSQTFTISEDKTVMHTYWTQLGRKFLYEFLKEHGILPLIERQ